MAQEVVKRCHLSSQVAARLRDGIGRIFDVLVRAIGDGFSPCNMSTRKLLGVLAKISIIHLLTFSW